MLPVSDSLGRVPRSAVWRSWFTRYGRTQLKPHDPARGMDATFYICKYLTKAPLLTLGRLEPEARASRQGCLGSLPSRRTAAAALAAPEEDCTARSDRPKQRRCFKRTQDRDPLKSVGV